MNSSNCLSRHYGSRELRGLGPEPHTLGRSIVLIPDFLGSPFQDSGWRFSMCSLMCLICRLGKDVPAGHYLSLSTVPKHHSNLKVQEINEEGPGKIGQGIRRCYDRNETPLLKN